VHTPVWALLGFTAWTLVVLVVGVGGHRWSRILTGRARIASFPADEPHGPPFYRRAVRAHANCVENLPVFGAIVLAGEVSGLRATSFDALAVVVVVARVLQTSAHLTSGSDRAVSVRFSFFSVQLAAFVAMMGIVVRHAGGW
jgi:uncharacterized MAPEG superfamily protein